MIGGSRYIKKRSSLKTNKWELFPPVVSKIITPVHSPCPPKQNSHKVILNSILHHTHTHTQIQRYRKLSWLTMARAVMDSFIHRLSSNKWPSKIQAQRRATNRFIDTTEVWSEVISISTDLSESELTSTAIVLGTGAKHKCQLTVLVKAFGDKSQGLDFEGLRFLGFEKSEHIVRKMRSLL